MQNLREGEEAGLGEQAFDSRFQRTDFEVFAFMVGAGEVISVTVGVFPK